METLSFLQDLAIVMIVAGAVTLLFRRLRQPVVLGYILAGIIVGPHLLPTPLVEDEAAIRTLADLGVIFLLFSLGLEFSVRRLVELGWPVLITALVELPVMVWLGYELGGLLGWKPMDRIFLGAILSFSSTTIVVKSLRDSGAIRERHGQLVMGLLIVEDIFVVLVMVLLTGLARTGSVPASDIVVTLGRLFIFLVASFVTGLLLVPRLLRYIAACKSDEMLLVAVLGLCFGISLLARTLGFSEALGAFLIGALVATSPETLRIRPLIAPIRDLFGAVFFVAIGLLIDPADLVGMPMAVVVVALVFAAGKLVSCAAGCLLSGCDAPTSFRVGTSMAQLGEFSFVLATLGTTLGVTSSVLYPVTVAAAALTALVRPYLVGNADALASAATRRAPRSLAGMGRFYRQGIAQLGAARRSTAGMRLARSLAWQITLNTALIAAVFFASAFLARLAPGIAAFVPAGMGGAKALFFLAAVILCLPVYIATARKIEALAMLLAEISTLSASPRIRDTAARVFSRMLSIAGLVSLGMITLLLSATLLPPLHVVIAIGLFAALLIVLFGTTFNRWYSRAKFSLVETWNQPPHIEDAGRPLPALLRDAHHETLVVGSDWPACGSAIRELRLRSSTGCSIIAIERAGHTTVNPPPEETLETGDQILLLGSESQLADARRLLAGSGA
jgi:monovalent cation:H+ antiporter-2, CPA2 family